ncbi:hypothetical protein B484DRAFT_431722, partial [Ochromonadaceae sp. CCMP2298]
NSDDVDDFEVNDQANKVKASAENPSNPSHPSHPSHPNPNEGGMFRARSGALPDLPRASANTSNTSNTNTGTNTRPNFDSLLNSFGDGSDEEEAGEGGKGGKGGRGAKAGEDTSVASEDIDAMEFSHGGDSDIDGSNGSKSSGEGSFSFLDSSAK